jgi:hypothetical protein
VSTRAHPSSTTGAPELTREIMPATSYRLLLRPAASSASAPQPPLPCSIPDPAAMETSATDSGEGSTGGDGGAEAAASPVRRGRALPGVGLRPGSSAEAADHHGARPVFPASAHSAGASVRLHRHPPRPASTSGCLRCYPPTPRATSDPPCRHPLFSQRWQWL